MIRVFIGLPRYGQVDPEQQRSALLHATADVDVVVGDRCTSLLANGFNELWCQAANDGSFSHWMLLHSDCAPQGPWLDTMLGEMDRCSADVLHACTAIKDVRGLTSTAVGDLTNEWAPVRRVAVRELPKLPVTFGVEATESLWGWTRDPARHLLPNTGVMLVKFGSWVREFPGFCIRDRIVGDPRVAQVVPEDWNFGFWCARRGLRVLATRAVSVDHYGRSVYATDRAWGEWDTDKYFLKVTNG